ncbi:MAG: hypothetical protein MI892_09130, partial [Desulfobacterales bacterium]|nr:hypothetical protein [Desulfobacterales bacterium]
MRYSMFISSLILIGIAPVWADGIVSYDILQGMDDVVEEIGGGVLRDQAVLDLNKTVGLRFQ